MSRFHHRLGDPACVPRLDSRYLVPGMLGEWFGRVYRPTSDCVESFCDSERWLVAPFVEHLTRFAGHAGVADDITVRMSTEPDRIEVCCAAMASMINDLYVERFSDGFLVEDDDGCMLAVTRVGVSDAMFPEADGPRVADEAIDSRLSCLLGAFLRHGEGPWCLRVVNNAGHKARLLTGFIERFASEWIRVERTLSCVPSETVIEFGPGHVLRAFFDAHLARIIGNSDDVRCGAGGVCRKDVAP